jgi:hypothetical protein
MIRFAVPKVRTVIAQGAALLGQTPSLVIHYSPALNPRCLGNNEIGRLSYSKNFRGTTLVDYFRSFPIKQGLKTSRPDAFLHNGARTISLHPMAFVI